MMEIVRNALFMWTVSAAIGLCVGYLLAMAIDGSKSSGTHESRVDVVDMKIDQLKNDIIRRLDEREQFIGGRLDELTRSIRTINRKFDDSRRADDA